MKRNFIITLIIFSFLFTSCSFFGIKLYKPDEATKKLISEYFTKKEQDKIDLLLTELIFTDEYNKAAFGVTYPTVMGAGIKIYMGTFNSGIMDNLSEEMFNDCVNMTVLHELCHVITFEHSFECNIIDDGIGHSGEWLKIYERVVKQFAKNNNYTLKSCYNNFLKYYTKQDYETFCLENDW